MTIPEKIKQAAMKNEAAMLEENIWMRQSMLVKRAHSIVSSGDTYKVKRHKLIHIIDQANRAIAPHAACKKGCSHCCNIALTLTQGEADAIGRAIGREVVQMPEASEESMWKGVNSRIEYKGVPCPFLVDHKCSIYAIRPVACRAHHSLDIDSSQCDLNLVGESFVPSYNLKPLVFSLAMLAFEQHEGIADIREFFPPQT